MPKTLIFSLECLTRVAKGVVTFHLPSLRRYMTGVTLTVGFELAIARQSSPLTQATPVGNTSPVGKSGTFLITLH